MKKLLLLCCLFSLAGHASISADEEYTPPTDLEVAMNRACFADLKVHGCGDPAEDAGHFKACAKESFSKLSDDCKALMTDLYSVK